MWLRTAIRHLPPTARTRTLILHGPDGLAGLGELVGDPRVAAGVIRARDELARFVERVEPRRSEAVREVIADCGKLPSHQQIASIAAAAGMGDAVVLRCLYGPLNVPLEGPTFHDGEGTVGDLDAVIAPGHSFARAHVQRRAADGARVRAIVPAAPAAPATIQQLCGRPDAAEVGLLPRLEVRELPGLPPSYSTFFDSTLPEGAEPRTMVHTGLAASSRACDFALSAEMPDAARRFSDLWDDAIPVA